MPSIRATPLTAALAGAVAAMAWPLLWNRFGASMAGGGMELVVASLLAIALPAHAFVIGFAQAAQPGRSIDKALFVRIGAWMAAAAATTLLLAADLV